MEVPGAIGGQPQCAAERGCGGSRCAGLHAVLQSHGVLRTEGMGENPTVFSAFSVCFEFRFPLVDAEILGPAHSALPYLAMLNNNPLKIKG